MLIVGARVSTPDPRINVGFREGTVIGAGEEMEDAVRLIYSGGEPISYEGEGATGVCRESMLFICTDLLACLFVCSFSHVLLLVLMVVLLLLLHE